LQRRLEQSGYMRVAQSLADAEFHSAVDLLATFAGRSTDLASFVGDAPINEDLNMRLQYLAGMGVNSTTAPRVYQEILSYRRFPADLLTGSGERLEALQNLIGRRRRTF
jgi:spermidine synthase